jgi:anti-sigma regulatory factor (Ser/Thr protein kinase)/GNAT superfamily N-acetyltransferase
METRCEYSQISIPADSKYLNIAEQYAGSVAEKFGFDKKTVEKIMRATRGAAAWIMDYSYAENEKGLIWISCEIVPKGFKVALKDKGLPFDPSRSPKEDPDAPPDLSDVRDEVDEVEFHNLGPEGKEMVLLIQARHTRITDYYQTCELDLYEEPAGPPPGEKIPYTVRALEPGEEAEVSKCVYKGYRYTYPYHPVYYPEKLMALNQNGSLFSAVAVTDQGKIMGHSALRYDHDRVAEMALGVVKPEFRRQGCLKRLFEFLAQKARSDGLMGVYAQPVTIHTWSQKASVDKGFSECALALGYLPATVSFKGVGKKLSKRGSVTVCFLYFKKPPKTRIYPPVAHQDMIAAIYRRLGVSPDIQAPAAPGVPDPESVIQTSVMSAAGFARIKVEKYGKDAAEQTRKALKELRLKKLDVVQLFLDISHPLTPDFSMEMEAMGFFFSGILPGAMPGGRDALILQYLNNVDISYEEMELFSDEARELAGYIQNRDPNMTAF